MTCKTTTAMYLSVSTDICASASASRSGNTITVSGSFSVSQGNAWNLNAIYACVDGRTGWMKVKPYYNGGGSWSTNFSFSFEDSGSGNPSYTAWFAVYNNAESQSVGSWDSVNFSVSYPAGATAPTGLGINNISTTDTSVSANVYVSGWGGAGDANSRYRNLSVMRTNYKPDNQRRYQRVYGNETSGIITVTSNTQYGTGTIDPNTHYWLWWYATNGTYGAEAPATSTTEVVTKASAPTVSLTNIDGSAVDLTWSTPADGGYYNKTVSYTLDNSTWTTLGTYSGGNAQSGQELLSLTPNTSYTIMVKSSTTAGERITAQSFTTLSSEPTITVEGQTASSVTIGYDFPADGGAFDKTLVYTIDGGVTWVQATTITGGGATSGTFTISGLEPGHSYNLIVRVTTGAGTITLDDIAIYTISDHCAFYGSAREASSYTFSYSNLSDPNGIIGEEH